MAKGNDRQQDVKNSLRKQRIYLSHNMEALAHIMGWTYSEMGDIFHISINQIYKYQHDSTVMNYDTYLQIFKVIEEFINTPFVSDYQKLFIMGMTNAFFLPNYSYNKYGFREYLVGKRPESHYIIEGEEFNG